MKPLRMIALLASLTAPAAFAQLPCDGEPQVLCSKALALSNRLADRNFRSFGKGERRIFKGDFHTVDKDGSQHAGPALGKNMWFSFETTRLQGTKDREQYVAVMTNDTSRTVSFSTVVEGFYGYAHLGYDDPRLKVSLKPLGGSAVNRTTFDDLDARDIQISHIPGTGTGSTGLLKHIAVTAILSPTLRDLIEASVVPSFALHKGADLDLIEAIGSGALQLGAAAAVLTTGDVFMFHRYDVNDPFFIDGVRIPDAELPSDCLSRTHGRVSYETTVIIPTNDLSRSTVDKVRTKIKCSYLAGAIDFKAYEVAGRQGLQPFLGLEVD